MNLYAYVRCLFVVLLGLCVGSVARSQARADTIIWRVDNAKSVGGRATLVLGAPRAVVVDGQKALRFNGTSDGLVLAHIPVQGWRTFTIEVLFKPDGDGP